jgi:hypothetical protein
VLDISGWDIRKAPPMLFDTLVDTKTEWEPLNELFLKILDGR